MLPFFAPCGEVLSVRACPCISSSAGTGKRGCQSEWRFLSLSRTSFEEEGIDETSLSFWYVSCSQGLISIYHVNEWYCAGNVKTILCLSWFSEKGDSIYISFWRLDSSASILRRPTTSQRLTKWLLQNIWILWMLIAGVFRKMVWFWPSYVYVNSYVDKKCVKKITNVWTFNYCCLVLFVWRKCKKI